MDTSQTARIVKEFYDSIGRGDADAVMNALSEDIEFTLPLNEFNKMIPYLGVKRGRAQVAEAFRVRAETTDVLEYEVRDLAAQDTRAYAVIYTKAVCRATKKVFEIEDAHRLVVNGAGKVCKWKVYFDPNTEVDAFRTGLDDRLIAAVQGNDLAETRKLLDLGANVNARSAESGLNVLMMAAGQGNAPLVKALLDAGADVFTVDSRGGGSALHKACQGGNVEVVRMLLRAGAFVDWVAPTTGHTPLMDALWFKWPDITQCLLENGATLGLSAHYGFSLMEHLDFEVKATTTGRDKLLEAEQMVRKRQKSDQERIELHKLMDAVVRDDAAAVKQLIQSGVNVDERFPLVNGFNDGHTALLVASRDGHTEIVAELLKAGANVNAVEPTFGAVPLHKAVYNGHVEITRMLARQPGVNLDYQGITNGYTALHDALWHGFAECAEILIQAGARLDLKGHDGKTPLDMAKQSLGPGHAIVRLIQSKLAAVGKKP